MIEKNTLHIIINKNISFVYQYTINPINTHLWISSIYEEVSEQYPPKLWTIYKNKWSIDWEWDNYQVFSIESNKKFSLKSLDSNYNVDYTYEELSPTSTKLTYSEWMDNGNLENPFTIEPLMVLAKLIEAL